MNRDESKLSICIDLGTTSSAVAVYLKTSLDTEPLFTSVYRWPGQEESIYLEHVPSALMYSVDGELLARGAEVYTREMMEGVEEQGYHLVEHFKMHLHPNSILQDGQHRLKPLPNHISLSKVYTDFLVYLLDQTRRHLKEVTGSDPWPAMQGRAEILLTHPNRWGVPEQQFLEKAAVAAGLVSLKDASQRLKFAEESEAAASYCLPTSPAVKSRMKVGTRFVICDVGGSTADISAYKVKKIAQGTTFLHELEVPACLDAGGVRTDNNLANFLEERLKSAPEVDEGDIPWLVYDGLQDFQRSGKRKFSPADDTCSIQIGGRALTCKGLPIKRGTYTLKGTECEGFFGPSVQLMIQAMSHYFDGRKNPTFLILTGGFGESPYIRSELARIFGAEQVILSNPPNGKAVATGGLRLLTGNQDLYRIDRRERPWPTRVTDFFSRFKGFVGL